MGSSKFSEKRTGTLNRFYTRSSVGSLLADQLRHLEPSHILDLGAGEGSLAVSMAEIWAQANFVTVDIDPTSTKRLERRLADAGVVSHRHVFADVLQAGTPPWGDRCFDLAVCNPPFFKPAWQQEFSGILKQGGLEGLLPNTEVTAETLFLAQNLRSLRAGGVLALIVPDGMMTNRRTMPLRRALVLQHRIEAVIQLPNNAFKDTDAYCFILILTKNGKPPKRIRLYKYGKDNKLSNYIDVQAESCIERLDYEFHLARNRIGSETVTLRQLGAEIKRGSLSTIDVKDAAFPTFHTTDYESDRISFADGFRDPSGRLVVAEQGDILVARIDRNFYQKVAFVTHGRAAITDCVYRVRVPICVQQAVFEALRSPAGAAALKSTSKGVSARLLGKADFLDLPLEDDKLQLVAKKLLQERKGLTLLL